MVEQGCSRFSVDENGRILDRLAGLEKIILPGLVRRALATTGKLPTRRCSLANEIMIWVVLAMGLFTEMPIRQVFKVSRRLRKGEVSPARSSLCVARQRSPAVIHTPVKELWILRNQRQNQYFPV